MSLILVGIVIGYVLAYLFAAVVILRSPEVGEMQDNGQSSSG